MDDYEYEYKAVNPMHNNDDANDELYIEIKRMTMMIMSSGYSKHQ